MSEREVVLQLPLGQAEAFSSSISDILCWARGFMAACPDETSRHPYGTEDLVNLNIKLKRAIRDAMAAKEGAA